MSHEVIQIIARELELPPEELGPEVRLRSIPEMESMKVLTIILQVEKRYGIELPDDATFRIETIGEFVGLVESLREQALQQSA
jgi:acyl carrier protein